MKRCSCQNLQKYNLQFSSAPILQDFRVDHLGLVSSQRAFSWRRLDIPLSGTCSSLSKAGITWEFLHPHQDINWSHHCAGLVQAITLLRFHGAAPCHLYKRQRLTADLQVFCSHSLCNHSSELVYELECRCCTIAGYSTNSCSNFKQTVRQEERGQGGVSLEKASEKGNV